MCDAQGFKSDVLLNSYYACWDVQSWVGDIISTCQDQNTSKDVIMAVELCGLEQIAAAKQLLLQLHQSCMPAESVQVGVIQ